MTATLTPRMAQAKQTHARGRGAPALRTALLVALWFFGVLSGLGQKLQLEIEPVWRGKPLVLGQPLSSATEAGISLSRLDGLLSRLALQRADGSWLESEHWYAFLSAQQQ